MGPWAGLERLLMDAFLNPPVLMKMSLRRHTPSMVVGFRSSDFPRRDYMKAAKFKNSFFSDAR